MSRLTPYQLTQKIYCAMRYRCENPKCESYPNYGGRGIKVCERWNTLDMFIHDMGLQPRGLTLDRKDNDGNYEPGNCRWVTRTVSNRNKRGVKNLTFRGETLCAAEWAQRFGLSSQTLSMRLKRGLSLEAALTMPTVRKFLGGDHIVSELERRVAEAEHRAEEAERENRLLRQLLQGKAA